MGARLDLEAARARLARVEVGLAARSQSRAWASFRANVRLPIPSGPTKSKACGNRPCARVRRRSSTTRSWPRTECQGTLHLAADPLEDRVGVGRGVDDDDRRGVFGTAAGPRGTRRAEEAVADAALVVVGPVLDPVARRADPGAGGRPRRRPGPASGRGAGPPSPPARPARSPRPAGPRRTPGRRCWPAGSGRRRRPCPAARAGRITSSTSCARLAMYRSISARIARLTVARSSRISRSRSPSAVPPGSRQVTTSRPRARSQSASRAAWVVLPAAVRAVQGQEEAPRGGCGRRCGRRYGIRGRHGDHRIRAPPARKGTAQSPASAVLVTARRKRRVDRLEPDPVHLLDPAGDRDVPDLDLAGQLLERLRGRWPGRRSWRR